MNQESTIWKIVTIVSVVEVLETVCCLSRFSMFPSRCWQVSTSICQAGDLNNCLNPGRGSLRVGQEGESRSVLSISQEVPPQRGFILITLQIAVSWRTHAGGVLGASARSESVVESLHEGCGMFHELLKCMVL